MVMGKREILFAGLCVIVLVFAGQPGSSMQANPSLNYRFGFGVSRNPIESYDPAQLAQLRAGMYIRWETVASPARPSGMECVQVVRVHQRKTGPSYDAPYAVPYTYVVRPTWEELRGHVMASPGTLWLIGNEMERVDWPTGRQDECLPEVYAEVYHEAYTRIKGWDPTAQVAVGGVCQVSPLRLEYLDRVLAAYRDRYGTKMPTDVWNVHAFVLREKRLYDGCPDCWGVDVPAGSSATAGLLYDIRDSDNLAAFKQQITTFRRWMRDHGERDKPLVISEYGVLMPTWVEDEDGQTFTPERVRDFMYGSFDYLQNATDPALGCPADKNRLVQRWIWFSLDADPEVFGGNLFDLTTQQMSPLGRHWAAYVNDPTRMPEPHVNLYPVRAWTHAASDEKLADAAATAHVTMTLQVLIGNSGSLPLLRNFVVRAENEAGQSLGEVAVPGLSCCGGSVTVSITWRNVPPGEHRVRIRVDPANKVAESDLADNELILTVRVAGRTTPTASPSVVPSTPTRTVAPTVPGDTPTPAPVRSSPTAANETLTTPSSTAVPTPSPTPPLGNNGAAQCLSSGLILLALLVGSLVRCKG
jgi:hypothetical protein